MSLLNQVLQDLEDRTPQETKRSIHLSVAPPAETPPDPPDRGSKRARLWIGLVGVDDGYTHDDVEENPSGPPPPWMDFDRMYGVEVEAGGYHATTHVVADGTYVALCAFTVDGVVTNHPVATVEVR